jgi:hypothetical protein
MKIILASLFFLTSVSAMALQVGDSQTMLQTGYQSGPGIITTEKILSINGDQAIAEVTQNGNSTPNVTESISNLNKIDGLFQNCAANGGALQDVRTPAKTFHACHITTPDSSGNIVDFYISPEVPLYFVKMIITDSTNQNSVQLIVQSFIKQ